MVRSRWCSFGVLIVVPMLLVLVGCTRYGASLNRPSDPVVLTGTALPKLVGAAPSRVVGFAWDGSSWHQIPVQVDERDLVNPGQIYHLPPANWPRLSGANTPYTMLVYTPPATLSAGYSSVPTYTPSDSNPNLDANDEISFLANDTGKQAAASAGAPAAVDQSTREEVKVVDPLTPSETGYAYLFRSATLTGGSAGTTGVRYTFSLDSGDYKATYKMGVSSLTPNNTWGFNPERSTVVTSSYRQEFGDRWLNNGLSLTANGPDVLDRTHFYVTVGCGRTEDTFDGGASNPGEGAFIANISGPVRAIRSYLGANSYVWTANTEIFYPARHDLLTELRGHSGLPGYGNADDFTTGTSGLTYSDPANSGVPINGTADVVTPIGYVTGATPPPMWQMVSGAQGSLVTVRTLETNITGLDVKTVYQDRNPASPTQCTGDAAAWGQNGSNVTSPVNNIPNTDPTLGGSPPKFLVRRSRYFSGPNLAGSSAAKFETHVRNPLVTTVVG